MGRQAGAPRGLGASERLAPINAWKQTYYGYMWWVYAPGVMAEHPERAPYTATGTGGQHIMVLPGTEVVIVHRGDADVGNGVGGGAIWDIES